MDAFHGTLTIRPGRSLSLRAILLLGVAWAALAFSSAPVEAAEQGSGSQVAPAGVVLAPASAVFRTPFGSDESLAPAAVALGGSSAAARSESACSRTPAERRVAAPTFFSRVAYRTTGPPHLNG